MDARPNRPAWPFAVTIFLGALLLFAVQPMIARFVLPWYGGAAAVWTTCVLFFQAVLLAGYAYAHGLSRWLGPRGQFAVHATLLVAALAFLPVIPSDRWAPRDAGHPTMGILLLVAATIGVPYFALSATSPLVQSWYARVHPHGNVYRLYALSNVASLVALLGYPFLIEPLFTRATQARAWSGLLVLFAIACTACAFLQTRRPFERKVESALCTARPLTASSSLLILTLTAIASAMLLAFTNKTCLDVAPVPFLWVVPLAIYLLTFIVAFEYPRFYRRAVFMPAGAAASFAVCAALYFRPVLPLSVQVLIYYAALFVFCTVCHGEVARLRPDARRLTAYFLLVSAGGVVGASFVTLAAPVWFSEYVEVHLTVFLLWATSIAVLFFASDSPIRRLRQPIAWVGILNGCAAVTVLLYLQVNGPRPGRLYVGRSFYGVLEVKEMTDDATGQHGRALVHNGIDHGLQIASRDGHLVPTSYYAPPAGIALAADALAARQRPRTVGVVGLGSGVMAAFARQGDTFRFFELDPDVAAVARSHFTYLGECPAKVEVVLGDARLSLKREAAQAQELPRYDLLVLDAFSGDGVPVHLLTTEAFDLYLRRLAPGGVLAVNVTNRRLNLLPPVLAAADHAGLHAAWFSTDAPTAVRYASDWLILTTDASFLDALRKAPSHKPLPSQKDILWTDERAALFPLLR